MLTALQLLTIARQASSDANDVRAELRRTPPWQRARRAALRRQLDEHRRHEQQARHLLGEPVPWPYEYWPDRPPMPRARVG